ncbi:MAG: glycosyltransferase family 9 protein [Flavobacterium sp.]
MMKILVIQQKKIGDVLVSSILCDNLRRIYPNAQIDYMVYKSTIDVLIGNTTIDNLILFEEKHRTSKLELLKFILSIRNEKYDLIIDAYSKLESWLVVLFSNAQQKISYNKKGLNWLYTKTIERPRSSATNYGLIIDERLALLEAIKINIKPDPFPKIYVSKDETDFARALFIKNNIDCSKKTVMVSIIGSESNKTYPLQYMVKVIDRIADSNNVNLLFNYIPSQVEDARFIFNHCKESTKPKIYFDVLGNNIRDFIAIMNQCDVIIGNDGGAINIAKSLKKPSFTIYSPFIDKKGWATFEDGKNNVSVHLNDFKPEIFINAKQKILVKRSKEIYLDFTFDLIEPSLSKFIYHHLIQNSF